MALVNGLGKETVAAGQLIIKANVGDDIRRIPIHNDDLTYDELILMMQRVFKGVLKTDEELVLKYKDEDGDLVSLTDTNDLSYAIQYSRVLRLTILTKDVTSNGVSGNNEVVKELREIRDRVNHLLDSIVTNKDNKSSSQEVASKLDNTVDEVTEGVNSFLNLEKSKEFDPLGQDQVPSPAVADPEKTRQMSGHSNVSNTSAPGQQQHQQQQQQNPYQQQAYPGYNSSADPPASYPGQQTASGSYPSQQPPTGSYPQPPSQFPASPRPAYQPAVTAPSAGPTYSGYPSVAPPSSAPSYPSHANPGATPTTAPSFPGTPSAANSFQAASTPSYPPAPATTTTAATGYPQQQQQQPAGAYHGNNQYPQQPAYPGQAQSSYPGQAPGAVYAAGGYAPGSNPYSRAGPPQGGSYPRPPQ